MIVLLRRKSCNLSLRIYRHDVIPQTKEKDHSTQPMVTRCPQDVCQGVMERADVPIHPPLGTESLKGLPNHSNSNC